MGRTVSKKGAKAPKNLTKPADMGETLPDAPPPEGTDDELEGEGDDLDADDSADPVDIMHDDRILKFQTTDNNGTSARPSKTLTVIAAGKTFKFSGGLLAVRADDPAASELLRMAKSARSGFKVWAPKDSLPNFTVSKGR